MEENHSHYVKMGQVREIKPRMRHAATDLPWSRQIILTGGHTRTSGEFMRYFVSIYIFGSCSSLFRSIRINILTWRRDVDFDYRKDDTIVFDCDTNLFSFLPAKGFDSLPLLHLLKFSLLFHETF